MSKTDGGPAFPHPSLWGAAADGGKHKVGDMLKGMSLRDWFAGQAMQGLSVGCSGFLRESFSPYAKGPCNAGIAERAYFLADAMLAEKQKG